MEAEESIWVAHKKTHCYVFGANEHIVTIQKNVLDMWENESIQSAQKQKKVATFCLERYALDNVFSKTND